MLRYLVARLTALIPTVLLVALFAFFLMHLVPGSPAAVMLGPEATPEDIVHLEHEMGLDKPLIVQLAKWLGNLARGDFGDSIFTHTPVLQLVLSMAEASFFLALLSLTIAMSVGVPAGIVAAVKRDSVFDQFVVTSALLIASVPSFWLGLNLMLLFAVELRWLPTSGFQSILHTGDLGNLRYLLLPAISMGLPSSALITRLTRSTMLDVIAEDYVNTARSKGLREFVVIVKHALRNASVPIVTVVSFTFLNLMSRGVVAENVFRLPGIGRLIVVSITRRDYPVIQGVLLVVAAAYVVLNLITDIVYVFLDPRIRY